MSINAENLYIKISERRDILDLVESVMQGKTVLSKPEWSLPCSFEETDRTKRTIAISPPMHGWILIVESAGFVDFGLAYALSTKLDTEFFIAQISEAIGLSAYLYGSRGSEIDSYYSEEDNDPLSTIRAAMVAHGIPLNRPLVFKDCIASQKDGWLLIRKDNAL